jgi:2-(1,2-epoxy-1,2-dihydrophenyl)acetyl-CoA isomerase
VKRLEVTVDAGIGRIRLMRPEAANTIDLEFGKDLETAAGIVRDGNARVVILSAEGKLFCGGGDLKDFSGKPDLGAYLDEVTVHLHAGIAALVELDAPVVASVQGPAAGAGLGLVCASDIVIAAESATFMMAYTKVGLSPDGSTSYFLPRIVGLRRALEMTITNRVLTASEALEWGLVTKVVPVADVAEEAESIAAAIAAGPTAAYGRACALLRSSLDNDLRAQLAAETANLVASASSPDAKAGIAAFLERRPPTFTGR